MNCKEKDGLLIFLLVFCGILFAVLGILIFFLLKNKSKWGNATKRATPEDGVDVDEEQQKEKKISTLGEAHLQRQINKEDMDKQRNANGTLRKSSNMADLTDIDKESLDLDDKYFSASGNSTPYGSIRTHKSQPSLGSVIINEEVKSMKSMSSISSKSSSSKSSSSSSSKSSNYDVVEVSQYDEPNHEYEVIQQIVHDSPVKNAVEPMSSSSSSTSTIPSVYQSSSSSSSSSDENDNDNKSDVGDVIVAEHNEKTVANERVEMYLSDILSQPMPIIEYDLGTDVDWPQRVDQLEREIKESERKFSHTSSSSSSSSSSSNSGSSDVFMAAAVVTNNKNLNHNLSAKEQERRPSSKTSYASSSHDVFEVDFNHSPMHEHVLTSTRNMSESSSSSSSSDDIVMEDKSRIRASSISSSSSSSSSSDAPTTTLAEVDLSVPFSQNIVQKSSYTNNFVPGSSDTSGTVYMHGFEQVSSELTGNQRKIPVLSSSNTSLNTIEDNIIEANDVYKQATKVEHVTSDDNSDIYRPATKIEYYTSEDNNNKSEDNTPVASPAVVKRAMKVENYCSSDNETPRLIRKATPIVAHTSSSSASSSDTETDSVKEIKQMTRIDEDDESFDPHELNLTQLILTENGHEKPKIKQMRGSNSLIVPRNIDSRMERISEASENGFHSRSSSEDDPLRRQQKQRQQVRRNSSGITSSSFIHKLSPDYESVYSREQELKRMDRFRDVYKSSTTF